MPRLNTYIEVGFCSGYGDGDHRISTEIEKFTPKQMNELLLAYYHAGRLAWDMWSKAQPKEQAIAALPALYREHKP